MSDSSKRKQYDLFGDMSDGMNSSNASRYTQPTRNAFYTDINDDIRPEDIFNMFFNGQFGQPNTHRQRTYTHTRRTYNTNTHYTQQQNGSSTNTNTINIQQFIHFLPIIILLFFSYFSMSSTDDTPYSIHRTPAMPIPRTTQKYETPYYVDRSFLQRYGRDTRAIFTIDNMVEQSWLNHYEQQCMNDKQSYTDKVKSMNRNNSNMSGEKFVELLTQVNTMRFESCEKLAEQYNKL